MTVRSREIAALAAAIERVRRFDAPADTSLSAYFRAHHEMGQRDRAFIADGAYAYLRRMRSTEALAASGDPRKLALAVLVRDLGHSLRDLEPGLTAEEAIWIRAFKSRLHDALPPAVAHDLPDWLWDKLGVQYGEAERIALAQSWRRAA